jgi:flagellar biosynthesis protein FlhG
MTDQAEKLRQVIDNLRIKQSVHKEHVLAAPAESNARVIAVTSGKGGVGKTNITINLALTLSELGQRVIVLDADFGLANVDVLFGIVPQYTLLDVIKNKRSILEVLTEGPKNIRFISGGSGVEDLVKLDRQQIEKFVYNMSMLDRLADIILVDTGAGLSENVMSFVMAADEVLLITTPEPTSITDAYALIKMVSNRDERKLIRVIVNRSESSEEANDVLNKLVLVADKFLGKRLEPAGYILNDEAVVKAVKRQQPFSILYPKSQAARNIREISERLVQRPEEGEQHRNVGIKGFLSRLVGFIKE